MNWKQIKTFCYTVTNDINKLLGYFESKALQRKLLDFNNCSEGTNAQYLITPIPYGCHKDSRGNHPFHSSTPVRGKYDTAAKAGQIVEYDPSRDDPKSNNDITNAELLKTAERMVTTLVQSNNNQGSSQVELRSSSNTKTMDKIMNKMNDVFVWESKDTIGRYYEITSQISCKKLVVLFGGRINIPSNGLNGATSTLCPYIDKLIKQFVIVTQDLLL